METYSTLILSLNCSYYYLQGKSSLNISSLSIYFIINNKIYKKFLPFLIQFAEIGHYSQNCYLLIPVTNFLYS